MSEFPPEDKFGNPIDGDRLIYCCFPQCGCDGARLCMAEKGASDDALSMNVEGMWNNGSDPKARGAVFKLIGHVAKAEGKEKQG